MKSEQLHSILRDAGYNAASITAIQEGSNHDVFDVTLAGRKHAICKFAKLRETERAHGEAGRDTLFGGRLSLERPPHRDTAEEVDDYAEDDFPEDDPDFTDDED